MKTTRRQFLAASAALPFALRSFAQAAPVAPRWVLLGTDKGKGIYRAPWNPTTGELGKIDLAIESDRPDYFARHGNLLYAANAGSGANAAVSCFSINPNTCDLKLLTHVSSHGDGPCYVAVDRTGRNVFVANYTGGTFTAYKASPNGALAEASSLDCHTNPVCGPVGPTKPRQDAPHLHCTTITPDNRFVLVCDLGSDAIDIFPFTAGSMHPLDAPIRIATRPGSGPRHVAFHPNAKWLYCIHELDCTIDLYDWTPTNGKPTLKLRQDSVISTLPKGVDLKGNTACEVVVSDDGRFLYACTRGTNDITVYRIDAATGLLTEQQRLSCGGKTPRIIAFDPSRKWLLSCNQGGAGSVTVFAHDPATGHVAETPKTFPADTPMFVQWV